jgi:hypothetical protein
MKPFNWTDKAAIKIAGVFITLQLKFTRFMNKIVAAIPYHKMKTLVIVFGLLGGGFSLYLITNAVLVKPTTGIIINPIAAPKYFDKTGEDIMAPVVDEELYRGIQAFKKSAYYDSTIWARPGLGDSIVWLEELYESQRIK